MGRIFRKIRKQKKISLQEIVGNDISYSSLATFERDECMLSFETLKLLVQKLQMSLDEFYSLCSIKHDPTEYELLTKKVYLCLHQRDLSGLQQIIQEESQAYADTKRLYHRCNIVMCKVTLDTISGTGTIVTDEEKNFIKDYLWQVDIWTKYELSVLNYTLPLLPVPLLLSLSEEVWISLPNDLLLDKLYKYKLHLINSVIGILLEKEKFLEAEQWLNKMKQRLYGTQEFYAMTYLYMLELLLEKKMKPTKKLEHDFMELKNILQRIGAENDAKIFDIEWHKGG